MTDAVGSELDVRRLQIAVDDSVLVSRFERIGNLLRDLQRFVERDRAVRNSIRERRAVDQLHHQAPGRHPRLFHAVDAARCVG